MIEVYDFDLDENGDLLFREGDLVSTRSELTHAEAVMVGQKGWTRHAPLLGADLGQAINSPTDVATRQMYEKRVRLNLEEDGFTVKNCNYVGFDLINGNSYPKINIVAHFTSID